MDISDSTTLYHMVEGRLMRLDCTILCCYGGLRKPPGLQCVSSQDPIVTHTHTHTHRQSVNNAQLCLLTAARSPPPSVEFKRGKDMLYYATGYRFSGLGYGPTSQLRRMRSGGGAEFPRVTAIFPDRPAHRIGHNDIEMHT